jgi:hypothetical protein
MRSAAVVLTGFSLLLAGLSATAQTTTRIETSGLYGAKVTVEEGVRVFRPVPPHDRGAINRTYLHRIGDEAGSSRYLRRVGEPRTESGIP